MSPDREQSQASLPLRADPAAGALIGTFLLALCLAGPVGLVLALVVWIVIEVVRRRRTHGEPAVDTEFAARFRELENSVSSANAAEPGGQTRNHA